MQRKPAVSVILSTYNSVDWLEKVLWSYYFQRFQDFEIIVADDGSTSSTVDLIQSFRADYGMRIIHVWQEDEGFQKCRILNKALLACATDYVLMSDGDCIARADYVETHYRRRRPGCFLSGGYFKLPMDISLKINKEDIEHQRCFDIAWLQSHGLPSSFTNNKLTARGMWRLLLEKSTPTKASWNGHNASGWLRDILDINGFDERMQYGGQDRELGERLKNNGIRSLQVRYSAICVHLDHKRGYRNQQSIDTNRAIRKETKRAKTTYTPYGIYKI